MPHKRLAFTTPDSPLSDALWRFGLRHPTALGVLNHLMAQKLAFAQVLDVAQIANTMDVSALHVHRAVRFLRYRRYVNVVQHKNRKVYMVVVSPAPQTRAVQQPDAASVL